MQFQNTVALKKQGTMLVLLDLSETFDTIDRVPRGSVLGPFLFIQCTVFIGEICRRNGVNYKLYADRLKLLMTKLNCSNTTILGDRAFAIYIL